MIHSKKRSVAPMYKKPVLIIGPLPPDSGGARTSFKLFLDYVVKTSKTTFRHFDLPVLNFRDGEKLGRVNHFRTILGIVCALFYSPFSGSVVIFGSRNFAFFYGTLFLLGSKCLRKPCSVRFFGGRPMLALLRRNYLVQLAVLTAFRLANTISLETKLGANEFPEFLQKKIKVVLGYRPRISGKPIKLFHDDDTIRFVYTGDIIKEKGINVLLDAFSELKSITEKRNLVELHLYGPGPKDIIDHLQKLDKVYYHGITDNLSLMKGLPSYDIFVFPSIYDNEGHPGAVIEALFAGLPIIASNLPVIREILKHESNALLVGSKDVNNLTEAMYKLSSYQDLRQRLSKAALASCDRFDAKLVLPKLAATLGF